MDWAICINGEISAFLGIVVHEGKYWCTIPLKEREQAQELPFSLADERYWPPSDDSATPNL